MRSIVRSRCLNFIKLLEENEVQELPLNTAQKLFMKHLGLLDDQTVSAYFGQQKAHQKTVINQTSEYATGTRSFRKISLTRTLTIRKAYFEILGLAQIEQRGSNLFFCVNQSRGLVNDVRVRYSPPHPLTESGSYPDECYGKKYGANFSLSPIAPLEGVELDENRHENVERRENREEREIQYEREKSDHTVIEKNDSQKMNIKEKETEISALNFDNSVIIDQEETFSTHLSDEPVKLKQQPSETDILSLYEKSCKDRGIEPDLLFAQTLTLEQRDRREAKK